MGLGTLLRVPVVLSQALVRWKTLVFAVGRVSEEEREEKEEDSSFVEGDALDVEELVRNELIVQWPIRVLCKDDCKGICSRCGANLNIQTCDCDTTGLDPRMAAIKDIFSKFKEV